MDFSYYFRRIFAKTSSPQATSSDVRDGEDGATTHLRRWNTFLRSYAYQKAKTHFESAVSEPRNSNIHRQKHVLPIWQQALAMACGLWHFYDEEATFIHGVHHQDLDKLKRIMWEAIVFLIIGTYYIKHGQPLSQMRQSTDEPLFLLHAATEILSTCCLSIARDPARISSSSALFVFHRILEQYPEQLEISDPFQRRLPIHISAANIHDSGSAPSYPQEPLRVGDCMSLYPNCSFEIMGAIVSKSPKSAASVLDSSGLFPLQLAAISGYSWSTGLEALFRMAPDIVNDDRSPPFLFLLSGKTSLTSLFLMIQASPHLVQQDAVKHLSYQYRYSS